MSLQLHDGGQLSLSPISTEKLSISPVSICEYQHCTTASRPPDLALRENIDSCPVPQVELADRLCQYTVVCETSSTHLPTVSDALVSRTDQLVQQMKTVTKATIGVLSTLITYLSLSSILRITNPDLFIWSEEDREQDKWIATSKSWIDRKACRFFGLCGVAHVHFAGQKFGHRPPHNEDEKSEEPLVQNWDWRHVRDETNNRPEDLTNDEDILKQIPDYILEYAPLVHLYSGEQFWPCDMAEHLTHTTPYLNYTPMQSESSPPTLDNLDALNKWDRGRWVFLTSNDNVEQRPEWLEGKKNMPANMSASNDEFLDNDGWVHTLGRTHLQGVKDAVRDLKGWFAPGMSEVESDEDFSESIYGHEWVEKKMRHKFQQSHNAELKRRAEQEKPKERLRGGHSDAPAVLIAVNKGNGVVDAFWFFFYSFNLGNVVFNIRFGNHVGDWEHTAIRFHNGVPKAMFFSEHNFGSVYSYEAVEKYGRRPVIYSAVGTHAMYATPGPQPYILPWGLLHDQTDRGPLWDPALNSHMYTYDYKNKTLRSSNLTPNSPTGWFNFAGKWGDKFYPLGDRRQYRFAGQYHYVNGPLGPKFKNLGRKKICPGPDSAPCVIKHWLPGSDQLGRWHGQGEDGDTTLADSR